ncbi:hypothetical protein DdX_21312 [Ditylenchus destructor]|uniref:Uncharacterized protein n=1 Tax=Ditylenchus destructor TaxID=166010 RepID=A0AAD4MGP6_9BILA|nr:hypothetical protein DdX_21312 [Ditylenchus destructor]
MSLGVSTSNRLPAIPPTKVIAARTTTTTGHRPQLVAKAPGARRRAGQQRDVGGGVGDIGGQPQRDQRGQGREGSAAARPFIAPPTTPAAAASAKEARSTIAGARAQPAAKVEP